MAIEDPAALSCKVHLAIPDYVTTDLLLEVKKFDLTRLGLGLGANLSMNGHQHVIEHFPK